MFRIVTYLSEDLKRQLDKDLEDKKKEVCTSPGKIIEKIVIDYFKKNEVVPVLQNDKDLYKTNKGEKEKKYCIQCQVYVRPSLQLLIRKRIRGQKESLVIRHILKTHYKITA